MNYILQEYVVNTFILENLFLTEHLGFKKDYTNSQLYFNYKFIGIHKRIKDYNLLSLGQINYKKKNFFYSKFVPLIKLDLQRGSLDRFQEAQQKLFINSLGNLISDYLVDLKKDNLCSNFILQEEIKLNKSLKFFRKKSKIDLKQQEFNNLINLKFISENDEKKKLIMLNSSSSSSSSFSEISGNFINESSYSNQNTLKFYSNELKSFINDKNTLSSFNKLLNTKDNFIKFKTIDCKEFPIKSPKRLTYEFKNNQYFIIKLGYFPELNIKVENGSNFFLTKNPSSNILIRFLQDIKNQNLNDEEALKFCLNILKLYNHENHLKFFMYTNFFNVKDDIRYQQSPIGITICNDKICNIKYLNLSELEEKDIKKFENSLNEGNFKEANNLLNKYDNIKKVNTIFLKKMIGIQYKLYIDRTQ